jgi:hypothetical protein
MTHIVVVLWWELTHVFDVIVMMFDASAVTA